MEKVDLLQAFASWNACENMFGKLIQAFNNVEDSAVAVLALEGLYRIERDVNRGQLNIPIKNIKNFLRKWRCESPLSEAYSGAFGSVVRVLRSLTIFKTLEVPLFIDDYGKRKLLSSYGGRIEDIHIDENTPIFHVTHFDQAQQIVEENGFKPSDNKNIIEGCWFGLGNSRSVYGSKAFETTLGKLGVTGLHQGEIVSYKNEINVILYAEKDTTKFEGLKKPTSEVVSEGAYVKISIFVPAHSLPKPGKFCEVVTGPTDVVHGPFCVKRKRGWYNCKELSL